MSVLVKYNPRIRLRPGDAETILDRVRCSIQGRVDRAYVFGSVAAGEYKPDSDIDLIFIKETTELFPKRGLEFLDLFKIYPDLDILVYTSAEFDRLISGPGFWNSVRETMRQLI